MNTVCRQSFAAIGLLVLLATSVNAQQRPGLDERGRLVEVLAAQQRQLDAQQKQLEELRALLLQQGREIEALRAAPGPALPATASLSAAVAPAAAAVDQAPAGPAATPVVEAPAAQEVPSSAGVDIGPARLSLGGYLAVTGIYRSTNSGGNVGTNFATTPFEDSVEGNVSEARLSAQSTRFSLRVDAPMPEGSARFSKLAGYFEVDFSGATPGTVAVTSSSLGLRLRHAFGEVTYRDDFSLVIGQAFSLMTPAKDQLSVWPSDIDVSQAVDTNYLAGLVWARSPQVRLTWRPSRAFNWAFSAENPEQQVGRSLVTWPACCATDLDAQYNTGSNELKVPNLMPDLATRVALNPGNGFHADVGGVVRVFRHTLAPYDREFTSVGGGVSANLGVKAGSATRIVLEGSWGSGMGRYQGGLVPDVVVGSDGSISPIPSSSWVAGLEHNASSRLVLAGYYSGVHASRRAEIDADGTFIGFGHPGAPTTNNRVVQEATGIVTWQVVKTEDRGSLQLNAQASWLSRSPWSRGDGPASAEAFLFLTQIRYNLP